MSSTFSYLIANPEKSAHVTQGREGSMLRMDYVFSTMDIIGHFTVVYLDAKPLIWSDAEGDLVVTETSI